VKASCGAEAAPLLFQVACSRHQARRKGGSEQERTGTRHEGARIVTDGIDGKIQAITLPPSAQAVRPQPDAAVRSEQPGEFGEE